MPGQTILSTPATAVGAGLTVITMALLVTGAAHKLLLIVTVTWALLVSAADVKTALFVPAFTPFTFHWYTGAVPPLTGDAVKLTGVPGQIFVEDAVTDTEATTVGSTVMVIVLLLTVVGRAQPALDVNSRLTTSPATKAVVEKLLLLVPAFIPLTFHW